MVFEIGFIRLRRTGEDIAVPVVKGENWINTSVEKLYSSLSNVGKIILKEHELIFKKNMAEKIPNKVRKKDVLCLNYFYQKDDFLFSCQFPEVFSESLILSIGMKMEYIDVISLLMPNEAGLSYAEEAAAVVKITNGEQKIVAVSGADGYCLRKFYDTIGFSDQKLFDFIKKGVAEAGARKISIGIFDKKFGDYNVNITVYKGGQVHSFSDTDKFNVREIINMKKLGLLASIIQFSGSVNDRATMMICESKRLQCTSGPYIVVCGMKEPSYSIKGTANRDLYGHIICEEVLEEFINGFEDCLLSIMVEIRENPNKIGSVREFFTEAYKGFLKDPRDQLSLTKWFGKTAIIVRFYGTLRDRNEIGDDILFDVLMAKAQKETMLSLMRRLDPEGNLNSRGNVLCRAALLNEMD